MSMRKKKNAEERIVSYTTGERDRFEHVMQIHGFGLLRRARRAANSRSDAEDLFADIRHRILCKWQQKDYGRAIRNPERYFNRIATYVMLEYFREYTRQGKVGLGLIDENAVDPDRPMCPIEYEELSTRIRELPDLYYNIYSLLYHDGFTVVQVAALFDTSEQSIRRRLREMDSRLGFTLPRVQRRSKNRR